MIDFKQELRQLHHNRAILKEREAKYSPTTVPLDLLHLIPFLNQATELIFLQRLGGSYRFIHRSVQEHFAAQWESSGEL
jgi:hypothetical protein